MSDVGERMPTCDVTDPASLESWYGNFGFYQDFRRVLIASCREIVRSSAALAGTKLTEARIDDLAHLQSQYLDFLTEHLNGRRIREESVREAMSGGYGR